MRKIFILTIAISYWQFSWSQHQTGFIESEAIELSRICNSYNALDQTGSDEAFVPTYYQKIYTSKALGMDNIFQVYADTINKKGIIHFRGSSSKKISWLENFYATLIPSKGVLKVDGESFNYNMSNAEDAYIHAGYTIGFLSMEKGVLEQIDILNSLGIYTIFITGHSQGGAIAHICMAYLDQLPKEKSKQANQFKVYAFANPMVGNDKFAADYNSRFCDTGLSYLIHNPKDVVIKMPIASNDTTFLQSLVDDLSTNPELASQAFILQAAFALMKNQINTMVTTMLDNVEGEVINEIGPIELPKDSQKQMQYSHTGNQIIIEPADYSNIKTPDSKFKLPQEIENSPIGSVIKLLMKNTDGQHKMYNYYTGLLKKYQPQVYQDLDQKVFISFEKK